MKRLFFILCIFCSFIFGFAQDEETLMNDFFRYLHAGQHEKVIELGSQLLSRMNEVEVENEEDKKDLEIARAGVLMVLAESYVAQQDCNKAIELGTQAVEINKHTLGENDPCYTSSLFCLSSYYYYNGDYAMAIELGTQALEITKRVPGEVLPNYASSLGVLAESYSARGDYTKAIEMGTQAVEINKHTLGENDPCYAISLNNLVEYYSKLGNNNKAIASLLQSLVVQKTELNNSYTVHTDSTTFCNILLSVTSIIDSDTCYNQFYSDASQLIIESMPIIRGIYDTDSEEYCRYLSYLYGFALFGKFTNIDHTYEEKSFDYLISMLENDLANVKKNKYEFYSMLSGAYERKEQKEKAIEYGEKKLQEALNHYISDRGKITYTYSLLISMYSRFNDVKRTESLLHDFLNYCNGTFTNDDINPITGIINGLPVALYDEFLNNLIDIYASIGGRLSDIQLSYRYAAMNNKVSILNHIEERMIPYSYANEKFDFYENVGSFMCNNKHINDGIHYLRKAIEYANSIDKREWNYSLGKSRGKDIIQHLYSTIVLYQSDPIEKTATYELMKQEMKQDLFSDIDLDKDLLYVSYADMLQMYSAIVDLFFNDYTRCIDLNTEALDMLSKSRFEDSFKELKGTLLRQQIGCFKEMHNYVYYEKGLLLCDSILCLKDNLIPNETLYNYMGQIYDNMKMYVESQTMYILAIQSAKSINKQFSYKRNLASSFIHSGNYEKGIELLEEMVNNPDTTASDFEKFSLYESLGQAYHDISPELALAYYDKAEKIELDPSYRHQLVLLYQKKASTYSDLAIFSKQKECLDKAVSLYKELNLNDPHLNAILLKDLADFYNNVNDVRALDQYFLAKEAFEKANVSLLDPSFESLMNNMALLLDNETAIEINTALCESRKNEYGTDHPLYATSLNNLAFCYYKNENYYKAIELGTQALEISKKIYGENHEDYILYLINLADYYLTSGNKSEYIKLSDQALAISKNVLAENHPLVEATLGSISHYYELEGELKMANKYYSKILYANYLTLLHNFIGLSSTYRTSLWSKYADSFQNYPNHIDNSNESIGDLYDKSCLFAKGLLLSAETEMRKLILESGDKEAVSKFEKLQTTRAWLNKLYEQPIAEQVVNIDSLEQVAERLETELVRQSQVYGDFMHNLKLTWGDVQEKLGNKDIAIEFLLFPLINSDTTQYIALTVKKGYDAPHLVNLFTNQDLQAIKSSYYKESELSQMVWGKMADELEGVKNIYFSPSGELYNIAIESMPHWEQECMMSDRFNLYRLSSTRELAINRSETKSSGAVIYGGIHFDTDVANMGTQSRGDDDNYIAFSSFTPDSVFTRGTVWRDLPGTLVEANEVYNILKRENRTQEKPLTGEKATETSFKQLSGQKKRILHIATHGFYYTESTAERKSKMDKLSFLQMNDKRQHYVEDKAMTRSGLIFAGANNTFRGVEIPAGVDDGVLTAQEISQLDLRGLDLLVLSACKTGLGEIKGDGVFGLQRGFKKAGAQTIMMSLRDVDDDATKDMMTQFYTALIRGKTKREAFIQAQQYLKDHDSEYKYKPGLREQFPHWAAFILLDAM